MRKREEGGGDGQSGGMVEEGHQQGKSQEREGGGGCAGNEDTEGVGCDGTAEGGQIENCWMCVDSRVVR